MKILREAEQDASVIDRISAAQREELEREIAGRLGLDLSRSIGMRFRR